MTDRDFSGLLVISMLECNAQLTEVNGLIRKERKPKETSRWFFLAWKHDTLLPKVCLLWTIIIFTF